MNNSPLRAAHKVRESMLNKWQLRAGSDTLVIIPRKDLYPSEAATCDPARLAANIDRWLADSLAKQTVLQVYEYLQGPSVINLRQSDNDLQQRSVGRRVEEAFRRREIVALLVTRMNMTQGQETEQERRTAQLAAQIPRELRRPKTWIEIELIDRQGRPVPKEHYRIELPDGSFEEGLLDSSGRARIDGIDPGVCKVIFPDLGLNPVHPARRV